MKKIKYVSFILAAVILLSSLSACEFKVDMGKKDNTEESTTEVITEENASEETTEEEVTVYEPETNENGEAVTDKSGEPVTKVVKKPAKKTTAKEFFTLKETKKSEKETISKKRIEEAEKEDGKQEEKQDDRKVIEGNEYTLKGRMFSDGIVSEFKMAQSGEKFALITNYEEMPLGVILNGDKVYLIDPGAKIYFTVPMSAIENSAGQEFKDIMSGKLTSDPAKIKEEGKKTVDGNELTYQKYEDGSVSYFSGKALVMTESTDGTIVYIDEIIANADKSLFEEPEGFEKVEFDSSVLEKYTSK